LEIKNNYLSFMQYQDVIRILGQEAEYLLNHTCEKINKNQIALPIGSKVDQVFTESNRNAQTLRSLDSLYQAGRLGGTGYLSIFPVDQGVEHTAAYSFYHNPQFFDPSSIVQFALEAEMSGVASTLGVLALVSRKYAHKIPFIVKLNHNELLTYPNKYDQHLFASVKQAHELGALGVGATIYFGSEQSNRQIEEISQAFEKAHELGMFTILWCYPRNDHFKTEKIDYSTAFDITSQANYLGVTLGADIIKQKLPIPELGFQDLKFAKYSEDMYESLATPHPIDLVRYQVMNCYAGKISLINSGGSSGENDLFDAVRTAVINKRAGGSGLIVGRKIFNAPFEDGIKIAQSIQDVYLEERIDIA
jgi:class I fructose-bisphosphate aldolase